MIEIILKRARQVIPQSEFRNRWINGSQIISITTFLFNNVNDFKMNLINKNHEPATMS